MVGDQGEQVGSCLGPEDTFLTQGALWERAHESPSGVCQVTTQSNQLCRSEGQYSYVNNMSAREVRDG